jgi:soluble lytic murein transglycosylase-like protein
MRHLLQHPWITRTQLAMRTFANDVAQGFFAITHNGMALMGLSIFIFLVALSVRPDLRTLTESKLISWLQERQYDELGFETDADAVDRATATDPRDLPKQQANLAYWLSRKYRVAPEPLSALITEAYDLGPNYSIDPTLILAVMAVESGFNPFAQSNMGAQGLMQVMTKVHSDKYQGFGGTLAAFDPITNVRVGVVVLRDCIQRAGGIEAGLKLYVGAGPGREDSGYANKVLAEQKRLQQVAKGVKVPITTEPTSAAEAATQRLESLWEKAQRLSPFNRDGDKGDKADE